MDLLKTFSTERKTVKWLESVRWNGKPSCAHCGSCEKITAAKSKKHSYWCANCRSHFTVKTGTLMHSSKVATQKWVVAIYCVMTARKGISSLQLSKEIGTTQKTAWFMLQRIRKACKQGEFMLCNAVEMAALARGIGGKRLTYKALVG